MLCLKHSFLSRTLYISEENAANCVKMLLFGCGLISDKHDSCLSIVKSYVSDYLAASSALEQIKPL